MPKAASDEEKLKELKLLLSYHNNALEQHKSVINQIESGELKFPRVSDKVLHALAKADLRLLETKKAETQADYDALYRTTLRTRKPRMKNSILLGFCNTQ